MKALLVVLCIVSAGTAAAKDPDTGAESRINIGILNFEQFDRAAEIAGKAQYDLVALVNDIGFYRCYDQAALEKGLSKSGKKMPLHCRDPRCVLDIGKTTGMDRMLFGSIEWRNSRCGVRMTLIDVSTRTTVETVNIQGAPGVAPADVLKAAVEKLHGHEGAKNSAMENYYGPKVHNERQFLISSAGCIGAGLLYGAINYGVEQKTEKIAAEYLDEPQSGLATTGVPLFARPAALANAYVAASDDAYGVLYNPAGLAWVAGPEAVLAYQYRFGLDNFAASYANKATREIGFGQALLYRADRDHLMTELYFVSAFAYKFNRLPSFIRPFSLGANVKVLGKRVKSTSDISSGGSSLGMGLDLGLLWEVSDQIRYGLLFRDVPVLNYWKNVKTGMRYFEPQPSTLLMGGTFQAGYSTFLIAEGQIPLYKDQPWKMAGGLEHEFFNLFLLRAGIQREIMAPYETPWKITGGFGLKVNTEQLAGRYLSLDGSYEYNTLHVFDVINISMRFGF
ncbi:MAG: hypothetical protein JW913_14785 [Chitinispirillaceae bacterium]|nr:hypothetical protein [Chitinispirillaceae bacterium]